MVRQALIEVLGLPESNVVVQYPGYDSARFSLETRDANRTESRRQLGIEEDEALVGLVTSGNFEKRGLHQFLECFERLRDRHENLRGLILGGRHKPRILTTHQDHKAGRVAYRPVTSAPERYVAAMDLVLYPAQYEEFGIVVLEAMAMGIPIVTSTAVGSAELLALASKDLVIEAGSDASVTYCECASDVLRLDDSARAALRTSLSGIAVDHAHDAHNAALMQLLDRVRNKT
jgi:glycosyltransferase involved in cell wall biosynthesis